MKSYNSLNVKYNKNIHSVSLDTKYLRELKKKEVLVKIKYSSLNYKDALSVTGKSRIIRSDNMTPGLDLSGIVVKSNVKKFSKGDKVLATGGGLGETIDGGFSEYAYMPSNILQHIPKNLSLLSSMQIGTAGFTAAIAIEKMLLNNQKKICGPILVSGATGGVGSFAINILNKIGFETIAITRNKNSISYLKKIGADKIIMYPDNFTDKLLNSKLYAGSIDNVGGELLDLIIKSIKDSGNIVSVGMASKHTLNTSVFPLIMRGVNILGVSSTNYPNIKREAIWKKLSYKYKPRKLNIINTKNISLNEIEKYSSKLISGKMNGRIVIKIH